MGRDVSNQPPSISVVLAPVDEATVLSSAGCAAVDAVLDDNEKAQLGRMRASGRRAQFILSRMMLRRALSRRADISPDDWRCIVREGGQPVLAPEFDELGLHFSISHTKALVGVAVSSAGVVGIDLEALARAPDIDEVRVRVFHQSELKRLDAMGPENSRHLVELWTGKEAVSKCLGKGLGMDFRTLALGPLDWDGFMEMTHGVEQNGRWHCQSADAPLGHVIAIAAPNARDIANAQVRVVSAAEITTAYTE